MVFHGWLAYRPNVDAAVFLAEEVMPRVRTLVPHARLRLVGRKPVAAVRVLANDRVEILADVEDVGDAIAPAEVAVCAMRFGTGVKNKLLEAAAVGLPTVATPAACEGLDLIDGEELLVRGTAEDMAAAIVSLLGDPAARERLGSAARRAVERRWSSAAFGSAYAALYDEIVARSRERQHDEPRLRP